jgi:hypothetical protein
MKETNLLSKFLSNFTQALGFLIPLIILIVGILVSILVLINNVPFWLYLILMPLVIAAIIAFIATGVEEVTRSEKEKLNDN